MRTKLVCGIALLLLPTATPASDLKITRVQWDGPFRRTETTSYVHGDYRRVDTRTATRYPLWQGARVVAMFQQLPYAQITNCSDPDKKMITLNLENHTYMVEDIAKDEENLRAEISAYPLPARPQRPPTAPMARHEITTADTGERKTMFGLSARHLIITDKWLQGNQPAPGATSGMVDDAWYADLDFNISCYPKPQVHTTQGTFTGYVSAALYGGPVFFGPGPFWMNLNPPSTSSSGARRIPFEVQYIGKPAAGYPLVNRLVNTVNGHSITTTYETTELSQAPLDPALFEVPSGYALVPPDKLNLNTAVRGAAPLWARPLIWAHGLFYRR